MRYFFAFLMAGIYILMILASLGAIFAVIAALTFR